VHGAAKTRKLLAGEPGVIDETHYAYLIHDAEIAHFLFSPDGNLVSQNTAQLKLAGAANLAGTIRRALFEGAYWTPELADRLAGGEVLRLRVAFDGSNPDTGALGTEGALPGPSGVVHLEFTVSSLGEQGYAIQAHDVTDEVESKAALRNRELFFRSVFQAIPYPTVVWKYEGSDRFTLHFYNASATEYSNGHLKKFDGADLDEFYSHEPRFAQRVRESFRTGQPVRVEQLYKLRTTGEERYVRITSASVGREYVLDSLADLTELRRTQEALIVAQQALERSLAEKEQEVHHRVKNNLQNVAALLRMQQRRAHEAETRHALSEAISRILSVAVIHEFLSLDETQSINVRDVCQRIVTQTRQALAPGQLVEFSVEGPAIYLPSQQATATALVINELVQNALEHGYEHRAHGQIKLVLTDGGDSVKLEICDDGEPLSADFDFSNTASLGLQIVRSLVQADLRGEITLENQPERGVVATVVFPKAVIGAGSTGR